MRRCVLIVIVLLTAGLSTAAQSAPPTPTPIRDPDVVRISTNLIQLDVSVTDSKGKPITDIKPGEMEIYENGEKQKITNFSFVSSSKPGAEKPTSSAKNTENVLIPQPVPVAP